MHVTLVVYSDQGRDLFSGYFFPGYFLLGWVWVY